MVEPVFAVAVAATVATVLMVAAVLSFVRGAMHSDAHKPSPDPGNDPVPEDEESA